GDRRNSRPLVTTPPRRCCDQRLGAEDRLHDRVFEAERRLCPRRGIAEHVGEQRELRNFVGGQLVVELVLDECFSFFVVSSVVHATGSRRWPSSMASLLWARWDLDFTVPSEIPSFSEISLCVMPSRCCMRTTVASSGASS